MGQRPSWKANIFSFIQEIPRILWNPKIRYCIHMSPPLVPVLSHINQVHPVPHFSFKIHFNIILISTSMSSKRSLSIRLSPPKPRECVSLLPHTCYMRSPYHPPQFYYPNIWREVKITKFLIKDFLQSPVTSCMSGSNILLSTLLSNTLSLCSYLRFRDQFSHRCKTAGKIVSLCILVFISFYRKQENKWFCTEW
jgi:hypothetical protein